MRVEWRIKSMGLEGWGNLEGTVVGRSERARIFHRDHEPLFIAEIEEFTNLGWRFLADKEDASLVEVLHWVEDELKFRASHR